MRNTIGTDILQQEWSSRNPDQLSDYSHGSNHRAIWVCKNGHEWTAPIKSRSAGYGCPYCSGRLAIPGENDLATLFPEITKQWLYDKNGNIVPSEVKPKSNRKFWWRCDQGHEWMATVAKRTAGKGCPYCAGKMVMFKDSLAGLYPNLVQEWDYDRNKVDPGTLPPHSNMRVWWICKKKHKWSSVINSRTRVDRANGCPYCANKRVLAGYNDLATTAPDIARYWDDESNSVSPSEVTKYSHKKVYWICPKGHRYKSTVANQANGKGCPICAFEQL